MLRHKVQEKSGELFEFKGLVEKQTEALSSKAEAEMATARKKYSNEMAEVTDKLQRYAS